ncbi:MAG: cytochrome P450 [Vicinamibacterales bacterium]
MAPGPRFALPWTGLRRFRRDPLTFLESVAAHGPVAEFTLGPQRVFLLSDPAAIEDVLVTSAAHFAKGRALERAKRTLGEGLLTSEGAFHLRQRRLMQPAFHRARIAGYTDAMARTAVATRERWTAGQPLDLSGEMNRLTLTIVADTLFGSAVGSDSDTARVQQAITDVMEMFDLVMLPFAEWLVHLPLPRMRRYRAAQRALDALIYGIIGARRASGADRGDLLSMLLHAQDSEGTGGMTDRQVRDEVITLFLAGHETTANALSWLWVLLGRHPEVEALLHAELDAVLTDGRVPVAADVARLPYTRAVVAESMRLYPPAWTMGRRVLKDYRTGGHDIPAGSLVLMSQWIVHRDPRWWPEPTRFDPRRWLGDGTAVAGTGAAAGAGTRPRFAYFPFGGGNRVCIGESFAWSEAIVLVAAIAQRWRLVLDPAHPVEPQPLITLRTRYGVRATPEARAAAAPPATLGAQPATT